MIATGKGSIMLLSAPVGPKGFFFHVWHEDFVPWYRVMQTAAESGRFGLEAFARARLEMGDFAFRRTFRCEFLDDLEPIVPVAKEPESPVDF